MLNDNYYLYIFLSGDEEELDTDPSPTVSSMTATHQKSTVVSKQVKVSEC